MILSPPDNGRCRISSSQLRDINSLLDSELSMLPENSKEETTYTLSNNQNPITTTSPHKKSFSNQIATSTKKDLQYIKKRITTLELKLNTLGPAPAPSNSSEFTISRATSFDRWLTNPHQKISHPPTKPPTKAPKQNSQHNEYLLAANDFLNKIPLTSTPPK